MLHAIVYMEDTFGARVRARRRAKEWTQAELGKRAGVTPQAISTYEKGRSEPEKAVRKALADALGCDEADLFPSKKNAPIALVGDRQDKPRNSLPALLDSLLAGSAADVRFARKVIEALEERNAEVEPRGSAAAGGVQNADPRGPAPDAPPHNPTRPRGRKRSGH